MDYRHATPVDVHSCVQILHKLFSNVLNHADDNAFRQVRWATAFSRCHHALLTSCSKLLIPITACHDHDVCEQCQVRTTSKAFARVQAVKGSEQYLRESGWRSRTADFTSFWVYEHRPATLQWECVASLLQT